MKRGGVWLGVGGLVCRENGDVLVVRKKYGATKGLWTLPGGFVSPGETLDEAVEREVREETGIQARTLGLIAVRTGVLRTGESDNCLFFRLLPERGEPVPDGKEVMDAQFVPPAELLVDPRSTDLLRQVLSEEKGTELSMVRQKIQLKRDYGYQRYIVYSRK
ncbi:NUDIX hydrolase [Kroppenstedtia guangzhouensis]|jgi:8-oxo-dGTP diphosphatase|uniref:NUDIX hydrolase n=1 Tax=Kroppenstedtia guangzhouensis TaxID=1274356 RepID=A0ABQ1GIU5_9BACL|nr:NUDIX domain-containing protein [Kroppenstedtia guangzhouensis]GGA44390.1 NUDIX hydrolase [Kroppenstedtia guangzhouensis]